jgi:hypothetical protein
MENLVRPTHNAGILDIDHWQLLNMVRHWFSTSSLRHTFYRLGLMPRSDAVLAKVASGKISKSELASIVRPILLSKECRTKIAQLLHANFLLEGRAVPFNSLKHELKVFAASLKERADAFKAGIFLPDDREEPPTKPEPLIVAPYQGVKEEPLIVRPK